ncbi:MAG: 2-isopropylmalate synthase [Candidatus Bathyarchaeia archaeon]
MVRLSEFKLPEKIRIFDTTLRDGEQTPGVALTPEIKLAIAKQLDRLGVDTIEVGFPISSPGEAEAASLIAREGLRAEICGLARTVKEDLDAALKCNLDAIHTFIATSELHLKYKLNLTPAEVVEKAVESVKYLKDRGVIVEFSAEDATRTDLNFLKHVYGAVVEAGADRINIPDTVGVMTPSRMRMLVGSVAEVVSVPISVHCHNDLGLAVANSLAGLEGGASQVHVTVNGLGERAGNAALEEVVVALHSLYQKKTNINTHLIYETSRMVSRLTGVMIQPNKAIVGDNAFAHESGIHTHGVVKMPLTYEPISPELVGRSRLIVAGKHAGYHGIKRELEEAGFQLTEQQMREVIRQIKAMGDKGKSVTTTDLYSIANLVCGSKVNVRDYINLKDLVVVTGVNMTPTASVKLILDGREYVASETGVGPVDAAMRAIQKVTDTLIDVRLKEFRLEALTGGSDALAEVIIKVESGGGEVVSARAAKPDIVVASVEAMVNGLNLLLQRSRRKQKSEASQSSD